MCKDCALRSAAQVDATGVRICAPEKAGCELYLTQTLRNATMVRRKGGFAESVNHFKDRGADVLSGLKPDLLGAMGKMPDARSIERHAVQGLWAVK